MQFAVEKFVANLSAQIEALPFSLCCCNGYLTFYFLQHMLKFFSMSCFASARGEIGNHASAEFKSS